MGVSANDMGKMKEDNPTEYDNYFAEVNFKPFLFRMRAKMVSSKNSRVLDFTMAQFWVFTCLLTHYLHKQETYNDETRLKTTVVEAKPFDPVSYGGVLAQQIDDLASKLGL